ncbi:hypothetical protein EYZ11_003936 [Aspergillus tanneri]|nr:hypothetical protein EYZ11_003936 [Aspergillus tanneri]
MAVDFKATAKAYIEVSLDKTWIQQLVEASTLGKEPYYQIVTGMMLQVARGNLKFHDVRKLQFHKRALYTQTLLVPGKTGEIENMNVALNCEGWRHW